MNFVLDNNVIISASLSKDSLPDKAFEKARTAGKIICSEDVYDELKEVIYREKFNRYFRESDRKKLLARYKAETVLVNIVRRVSACRDPKDNKYLELALSGNADYIVTGDQDLLVLGPFKNIPIVTPAEFLDKFR